jgi:hypothetical protein
MKRVLIALLTLTMVAGAAYAGPGGGGARGGRGPEGGAGDDHRGGGVIVGDNGTVFVTRLVTDATAGTTSTQIVAINAAGTTVWTASLAERRGHLVLSGSNLLSVTDSSTDTAVSSTITAISTATGAQSWTVTLNGRITELEPFSGGTYAIVIVPPATAGGTATRNLVAISNSGATLWTVAL